MEPSSELASGEHFWYNHRAWLEECGYRLRPRYQPGWVPSWTDEPLYRHRHEDSHRWPRFSIMDATVEDGSVVVMKQVDAPSAELDIALWFSAEPQRSDPANHCVPVDRVLSDPKEPTWAIIVMPLLRKYDDPRFDTVGEVVAFLSQIFEGLQFMHKNNIAHRDCTSDNIMMDGSALYRDPFHPIKQDLKRDFSGKVAPHLTRTRHPVKYFFTDFGLSKQYKAEERPPSEYPVGAGDKTAPEYRADEPCDPFPTDVYLLGNLVRTEFLQGTEFKKQKLGLEFMWPLVNDMVQQDSSLRPDMDTAVRRFNDIVRGLSSWKLRSRVRYQTTFGFISAVPHWIRRIQFILRRVPPTPLP